MRHYHRAMRMLLRLLTLLLSLAIASPAIAQSPSRAISAVDAALDRAKAMVVSDPEKGLKLVADAETAALALPDGRGRTIAVASALRLRSEAYMRLGDATHAR